MRDLALWLLAGAWLVVLLLQTTWSRPFWEAVPYVKFIQFPWRLLVLASFTLCAAAGLALLALLPPRAAPAANRGWRGRD